MTQPPMIARTNTVDHVAWEEVKAKAARSGLRTQDEIREDLPPLPPLSPHDPVNHPEHYTSHPSGVEAITVTEHMNFCLGSAMKYIWRAGLKDDSGIRDLKKARWFLTREIDRLERLGGAA